MKIPVYRALATLIEARANCIKSHNVEWLGKHTTRIATIARNFLPSGSGVDNGSQIDLDASTSERIVIIAPYHHMNDGGMYDGWTDHTVTVRPSLTASIALGISGRNRNETKEYLHDVFHSALMTEIDLFGADVP